MANKTTDRDAMRAACENVRKRFGMDAARQVIADTAKVRKTDDVPDDLVNAVTTAANAYRRK